MNFVCSLFILTMTILIINFNVAIEVTTEAAYSVENDCVTALIQHHISVESSLWNEMKNSESRPDVLIWKINNAFDEALTSEIIASVTSDKLKFKFENFLNLTAYESGDQNTLNVSDTKLLSNNISVFDIFELIRKDAESQSCDSRYTQLIESSKHNVLLFYQLFAALIFISYATEQRRNMIHAVHHGVANSDYVSLTNKFNVYYETVKNETAKTMNVANPSIWMCDPDFYMKDDESIQITNLLQGYVENEVNLNEESSCTGTCDDYKFARNRHCASGTFCHDQTADGSEGHICNGTIVDCIFVESDMEICPSVESNKRRRYDHIKYSSGRVMGREFCHRKRYEVESYLTGWLYQCSYCFCYCDADNEDSDRYFSLKPAVSDVSQNKIITGVGLFKINGIFSWSITQSTLRSFGRVDQLQENLTYSASDPSADELYQVFNLTESEEDVDYRKLSWQNRSVNLATNLAPKGCVITGIRFKVMKEHLHFEIRYTSFDFNTGILNGPSLWDSNRNGIRSVLLLDRPEPSHPIHINSEWCKRSIPDFTPNKFIKFRPSDPDKDAGQTTVPFIDTQMVRPEELTLISGISLYYKGRPGFGGFIAPKLIVYDMSSYVTNLKKN